MLKISTYMTNKNKAKMIFSQFFPKEITVVSVNSVTQDDIHSLCLLLSVGLEELYALIEHYCADNSIPLTIEEGGDCV